jgi:hypothetical protein
MSRNTLQRMMNQHIELRPGKEHDDTTPSCYICGEAHVGINTEASLLIKGAFVFDPENGCAVFLVDPHAQITPLMMSNGQLALAVDTGTGVDGAHTDCIDRIVSELFNEAVDEEEAEIEELFEEGYDDEL